MTRRRSIGEGSLYFDDRKQRWVGALYIDGRRHRVFEATKTAARKRLDDLRRASVDGSRPADGNVTLNEILDRWESRVLAGRDLAPSTAETYAWAVERLRAELGSKRIRVLTVDHVEAALDAMARGDGEHRPLGRAGLIKVRSVLGQALDFAIRRGTAIRNVARMAELTPTAARPAPRRSLDADGARRLLAALDDHRLGALFIVMMTIGLRPGEAAALHWGDVDFKHGRIAVRRGLRVVAGKPKIVDELKTARSRRTIDLPEVTASALRAHRQRQRAEHLAARNWASEELVFATRVGTPLDPTKLRRELARISESAGLGVWRPNELRHTAASLLSDAGVPLEHVADLLGHTNTRMLEATYRHAVQPSIGAAVAPMDRIVGG